MIHLFHINKRITARRLMLSTSSAELPAPSRVRAPGAGVPPAAPTRVCREERAVPGEKALTARILGCLCLCLGSGDMPKHCIFLTSPIGST